MPASIPQASRYQHRTEINLSDNPSWHNSANSLPAPLGKKEAKGGQLHKVMNLTLALGIIIIIGFSGGLGNGETQVSQDYRLYQKSLLSKDRKQGQE